VEGGIGAILKAMQGHPESEEVQAAGCDSLQSQAVNADNKVQVAAEDYVIFPNI
jgi:endo-1,4-beta-mannosidase